MRNQEEVLYQSPRGEELQDYNYINELDISEEEDELQEVESQEEQLKLFDQRTNSLEELILMKSIIGNGRITLEDLRLAQATDPEISELLGKPEIPPHFKIVRGVLVYVPDKYNPIDFRLYLPQILLKYVLTYYHMTFMGMHRSSGQLYKAIRNRFYCRKLKDKVKEYITKCYLCKTEKSPRGRRQPLLGSKTLSAIPREDYQFDIFELPNVEGYRYCYVWVDLATNFTVLVPARSRTAIEIKQSLERISSPFLVFRGHCTMTMKEEFYQE